MLNCCKKSYCPPVLMLELPPHPAIKRHPGGIPGVLRHGDAQVYPGRHHDGAEREGVRADGGHLVKRQNESM